MARMSAGSATKFPPGSVPKPEEGGLEIAPANVDDACTHAGASLSGGASEGCNPVCGRRGTGFDCAAGGPATFSAKTRDPASCAVSVSDGGVYIDIPDRPARAAILYPAAMHPRMMGGEAELYEETGNGAVRCTACARYCALSPEQTGLCGVRTNVGGRLNLDVYGRVIAGHVDPIEKKPVTHYMPGSKIFSIATTGCNWLCRYCQNHDISQRRRVEGEAMSPELVAETAARNGADGIAYTYNEPSIFIEFARDCGLAARRRGIFNVFVSNGYDTPESVAMMGEFLDSITIDFKGSAEPGFVKKYVGIPDPQPIFDTILEIHDKTDIHVEITDLVVPEVGDSPERARSLCGFVHDNLGPDTPIHFLRFHPDYKMTGFGLTPVRTLEEHRRIALEAGLRYAYVGNVPGHPYEHTYCPGCGGVAVGRYGFDIVSWNLDDSNRCASCGCKVYMVGRLSPGHARNRFHVIR